MIHGVLPFSEARCLQARYFLSVDARRARSVIPVPGAGAKVDVIFSQLWLDGNRPAEFQSQSRCWIASLGIGGLVIARRSIEATL